MQASVLAVAKNFQNEQKTASFTFYSKGLN